MSKRDERELSFEHMQDEALPILRPLLWYTAILMAVMSAVVAAAGGI